MLRSTYNMLFGFCGNSLAAYGQALYTVCNAMALDILMLLTVPGGQSFARWSMHQRGTDCLEYICTVCRTKDSAENYQNSPFSALLLRIHDLPP